MLNAISKASGQGKNIDENWLKLIPQPFQNYNRQELQNLVDNIIVSHKPDHGSLGQNGSTSGRLHEDTFYGIANNPDVPEDKILMVVRVPILSLREKDIADIRDPLLRNKLQETVNKRKETEKVEDIIAQFAREHNIRRIRILVEKSKKAMKAIKDKQGKPYRYVATGGNHHIDIFCPIKDKKELKIKAGKWYAETVSTFDANQKNFAPQWKKDHPTAKLVMRLHINDMVAYEENGKREIYRVQKLDGYFDAPFVIPHLDSTDKQSRKVSAKQLQEKNARKIAVTPAGKVLDPGKAPMPKPFRKKEDKEAAA